MRALGLLGKTFVRLAQLPVDHGNTDADPAPAVLDALDCLRVAVTVYDSSERLIYANAHYNYLFRQLPPQEDLIGKTYSALVGLELASGEVAGEGSASEYIALRRAQFHASDYAPFDLVLFDGRVVKIKTRRTQDGGWVALWTDATQARAFAERAARRLAKSKRAVKKQAMYLADLTERLNTASADAGNAQAMLLRTMSHELKTPLNAILGFAGLIQNEASQLSPTQVADYSALIHQSGANLLRLINQILDLTKVAAGRFPLSPASVPVGSLFHDVLDMFATRARNKRMTLIVDVCARDAVIRGDEGAATMMLCNLVENALTFTPDGGCVRLSAMRDGAVVRIAVADNGPGVSPEDLARITEPFEQAEYSMSTRPDGAGLGLALVKALAELQNGRLSVESEPEKGFTATVELPAA